MKVCGELAWQLGPRRSAVLRFTEEDDAFVLDLVLVPSEVRSEGIGSALVRRLLDLADAQGKAVNTTARPIGRLDPEVLARLVSYYERFGFAVVERKLTSVAMRRPPRPGGTA